jgi:broad specificity phosphatase PhoE
MKFVLFRHANKGILPFEDPELSPVGFQQSVQILNLVNNMTLPPPSQLWVSPKRRTSQTLYAVSKEYSVPMQIKSELDQRGNEESSLDFRKRVEGFIDQLNEISRSTEVIYACTHYDWIEDAMTIIECDRNLNTFEFSHWAPSQYLIFDIQNLEWKLLKKGDAK